MEIMTPENCTCFNLRKATRVVTQLYDEALKPTGLRSTQFSLLCMVQSKGPVGVADLANALVTDRTTLTRNLNPLMDRKLLKVIDGSDARRRPIVITSEGIETLNQAMPLWRKVQSKLVLKFGNDRWANMIEDLNATVNQIQAK